MRILRTWLLAAAMLALGSAAAGQSAPADAWPQFRGTAGLSGVSTSQLPDEPQLLWTLEAGESIDSSAAIADGVASSMSAPTPARWWPPISKPASSAGRTRRARRWASASRLPP